LNFHRNSAEPGDEDSPSIPFDCFAIAGHGASSACADTGNSGKPDACTRALGEAEIKASGQTPEHSEKFRRFGKATSAFADTGETPGKSPTKSNRWNMGWNTQQYSIYGGD